MTTPTPEQTATPGRAVKATPRATANPTAKPPVYAGANRFWFPALGIAGPVRDFPYSCYTDSGHDLPDAGMWRWNCGLTPSNRVLLSHADGSFSPLRDAYHAHTLKVGLTAWYGDSAGVVTRWRVAEIRHVRLVDLGSWELWAVVGDRVTPTITMITCDGPFVTIGGKTDSEYRIVVRLRRAP
jgi:hypothetical protein